jgi:hypothetical protein
MKKMMISSLALSLVLVSGTAFAQAKSQAFYSCGFLKNSNGVPVMGGDSYSVTSSEAGVYLTIETGYDSYPQKPSSTSYKMNETAKSEIEDIFDYGNVTASFTNAGLKLSDKMGDTAQCSAAQASLAP